MDSIKSSDNDIKVITNLENNNIYTMIHFFFYLLSYFKDFTLPHIFQVDSTGIQVHFAILFIPPQIPPESGNSDGFRRN